MPHTLFSAHLCKFRLGTTQLQVRDHTIRERAARICPICLTGVEDEKHVVLECDAYAPLRRQPRWASLFTGRGTTMQAIMTHMDQYRLASFLVAAMRTRKQLLQELHAPPSPTAPHTLDMFDSEDDEDC
jgi:hypothetical protein